MREGLGSRPNNPTENIIGRGIEDACVKPETTISDGWGGNIENFGGHLEQWGSLPC